MRRKVQNHDVTTLPKFLKMDLKMLLPFDNFKLHTKLKATEVNSRISGITEPKKNFIFSFSKKSEKPYEGKVFGNSFEINRIIQNRNSFLRIIYGNISSFPGQTQVYIKMRPILPVIIFMSIYLGGIGFVCIQTIVLLLKQTKEIPSGSLIPFLMFAFGFGLLTISYRVERNKSKAFLKKLLEAED